MIDCIEETGIMVAMVGLLVALPNTQLTRRLMLEGRMIDCNHQLLPPSDDIYRLENAANSDNTTGGLNFVTTRSIEPISMMIIDELSEQFTSPLGTWLA